MSKEPKKFCRIADHLRIAVGVEIPNKSLTKADRVAITKTPGVAEVYLYEKRDATKVYLDLEHVEHAGMYPDKIQTTIPSNLSDAPWGEVLFSNNRTGAQVLFGREDEEKLFGPIKGKYVVLRLEREKENPFPPLYVRIDKDEDIHFFVLKAKWESNTITIEIEHEPSYVPHFLS